MNTSKVCTKCNNVKETTEFLKRSDQPDKFTSHCKKCISLYHKEYCNTKEGFLKTLYRHAKIRVKDGKEFTITYQYFLEILKKQEEKCYYLNIKLTFKQFSDWQCSLERLDQSKGYIEGNIAFVCLELNVQQQWTIEKINNFVELISIKHKSNIIIDEKPNKTRCKVIKELINDIEHIKCTHCNIFKLQNEYTKVIGQGCKECIKNRGINRRATLSGAIVNIFNNCKKRHNKFINKNRITEEFNITYEYLIDLFNKQNGLCAYSGIPLKTSGYWKLSLERINSKNGYTKDNVCFICQELNSTDRSCMNDNATGSGGWSKEKIDYIKKINN